MPRILRLPAVLDRTGKRRSPIYADIQAGLFVRPIKIGDRAAGFLEHEVDALIAARVAGATKDQIRRLVEKLHEQRNRCYAGVGVRCGNENNRVARTGQLLHAWK